MAYASTKKMINYNIWIVSGYVFALLFELTCIYIRWEMPFTNREIRDFFSKFSWNSRKYLILWPELRRQGWWVQKFHRLDTHHGRVHLCFKLDSSLKRSFHASTRGCKKAHRWNIWLLHFKDRWPGYIWRWPMFKRHIIDQILRFLRYFKQKWLRN